MGEKRAQEVREGRCCEGRREEDGQTGEDPGSAPQKIGGRDSWDASWGEKWLAVWVAKEDGVLGYDVEWGG